MMVRKRISNPALVEDVVQDTLMTLHRIRHTYDPGRPFLPWLSAIASARAIDALRRHGRMSAREIHDPNAFEAYPDDRQSEPENALAARGEVAHLLATLSPRQRRAIELVKLHDMSLVEAAGETGFSIPALKTLLHRAITKLRSVGGQST
jgi:RNA polymerase sigma-70 factor (ECF subfamily)